MKNDLTVIYYTANMLKEDFAEKVREQIKISAGSLPIISVSKKPLDFGLNIIDQSKNRSVVNIFNAILTGAKHANTNYIALAEDDILYSPAHFYSIRPPIDTFAYNLSKWTYLTWKKPPFYSLKFRRTLSSLVAPRELIINYIEERFARYDSLSNVPDEIMSEPGRGYEEWFGFKTAKVKDYYTYEPIIAFSHPDAMGWENLGSRKKAGIIRAYDIPYWGTAQKTMERYWP